VVRVGAETRPISEILEGLSAGSATSSIGTVLIDSEASLRGAFENLPGRTGQAKRASMRRSSAPLKRRMEALTCSRPHSLVD